LSSDYTVTYHSRSDTHSHNFLYSRFFFFYHTATTEIYTLSLHDALPILIRPPLAQPRLARRRLVEAAQKVQERAFGLPRRADVGDRKSTRLNSSHVKISYAVFCLKKKKKEQHKNHHEQDQQMRLQDNHGK